MPFFIYLQIFFLRYFLRFHLLLDFPSLFLPDYIDACHSSSRAYSFCRFA